MPPSYYLGRFYIGIWRTDVGTFYQEPLGGSLALLHGNLSDPNLGSLSTPVGFDGDVPRYVIGWDNLDVLLPANVQIQISLYAEGIQIGDFFGVSGSSRPGPFMLRASSDGNNGIGQPMACRLTVSDEIVTAANADISGRVVNQSGRGIPRARLTLQNTQTGKTYSVITNPFGYFRFTDQPAGNSYILSVNAKRLTFQPNTRTFQLLNNITDLKFVGSHI